MNDNDILQRLRALSRYEHSDFSIGDEAADEIDRLRKSHRKLHRRCQEAEAALPDYERIIAIPPSGDGIRFVSGSFGRALLAGTCNMMHAEIVGLREQHARDSAELAALRKRIEDAPWQPIETAPKDRLLSVLTWDGKRARLARRDVYGKNCNPNRYRTVGGAYHLPTHWMPLPPPPEEE